MKGFVKKLLSCTLAAAMICTLAPNGGGSTGSKVEAASSGKWVLTATDKGIPGDYSSGNIKYTYKDGGKTSDNYYQLVTIGGDYDTTYQDKKIQAVAEYYQECQIPKDSYTPGETISLQLRLYTKNSGPIHFNGKCQVIIDGHEEGYNGTGTPTYSYMTNSKGNYWLEADNGNTYAVGDDSVSDTFTAEMPKNPSDGDKLDIAFLGRGDRTAGSPLYYKWIYTYSASGSSDDDDADSIGEDTDDEDDIVVGQVKNVKLTNKKVKRIYISYSAVSGAKGYEIQYATNKKLSGAKKLTSTTTKGYLKKKGKKATFKKGKTYYARVRAYAKDSKGNKIYGKWSAKKKVKIKK